MKMRLSKNKKTTTLYEMLYALYGPQGWWPLCSIQGVNPTKTGSLTGYHPGNYRFPRNDTESFEIAVGAICTQNTSWVQAEKAVKNLYEKNLLVPEKILRIDEESLSSILRPAGYFNQKTKKLKALSAFWEQRKDCIPSREALLGVWGVGPETADSILLYAFSVPSFVVDAYTRRIFSRMGFFPSDLSYEDIRAFFMNSLPKKTNCYQEYHALLVEHAKRFCTSKPSCKQCPLLKECAHPVL